MSRKMTAMALTGMVLTAALAAAAPQASMLKRQDRSGQDGVLYRAPLTAQSFEQLLGLRGVGRTLDMEREDDLRNILLALARTGGFRITFEDFEADTGAPQGPIRFEMTGSTVGEALVYLARNFGVVYEVVSRDELRARRASSILLKRTPAGTIRELPMKTDRSTGGVVREREAGPEPVPVGGPIQAPERIEYVAPRYPEEARRARLEGVVILEAEIDKEGNVVDTTVLRGLGLGLDEAAAEAVRQWKYTPTVHEGRAVDTLLTVTVQYTLGEGE